MTFHAQLTGTWIDVDTYVIVNRFGQRINEIDGGLFTLQNLITTDDLGNTNVDELTNIFISFEQLVNQGYAIGDQLTIDGTMSANYLMSKQAFFRNRKNLDSARKKMATLAENWGKKNVPKYRQPAWAQQNKDLISGKLSVSHWFKNLRYLLFQDRDPSPAFLKFQDKLSSYNAKLHQLLVQASYYTVIVDEANAISTHKPEVQATTISPDETPVYREVIIKGVPMRENYKAEWAKYRKEADAYRQAHGE